MGKINKVLVFAIVFVLVTLGTVLADDEMKVKNFTVDPSSFQKGQTVRFSVELENPTDNTISGAGEIYFDVQDGTPERAGPGAFLGKTRIPTIAPHTSVTVNIAQTYKVPSNADDTIKFYLRIPSIVPGKEFLPTHTYIYTASCTYSPMKKIMKPLRGMERYKK